MPHPWALVPCPLRGTTHGWLPHPQSWTLSLPGSQEQSEEEAETDRSSFPSQPPVPQTMQGEGPQLLLSEAVSRAAKAAGARPLTSPESLSRDLEAPEVQESYRQQVPPPWSRIGMV